MREFLYLALLVVLIALVSSCGNDLFKASSQEASAGYVNIK